MSDSHEEYESALKSLFEMVGRGETIKPDRVNIKQWGGLRLRPAGS